MKNHWGAHSCPTSHSESPWKVKTGLALCLEGWRGSPGEMTPPRCCSVVRSRWVLLDPHAAFKPTASGLCTLDFAWDTFSTLLFLDNSHPSIKIKPQILLYENLLDSPLASYWKGHRALLLCFWNTSNISVIAPQGGSQLFSDPEPLEGRDHILGPL